MGSHPTAPIDPRERLIFPLDVGSATIRTGWQRPLDELRDTISDPTPNRHFVARRQAGSLQGRVEASSDIRQGVDERAIEVEDHTPDRTAANG